MTLLGRSALATILFLGLPAPAFAQDMCAALQRIVAASREDVPFASLEALPSRAVVPGYDHCRVETRTPARQGRILCSSRMAPASLTAAAVGRRIEDCFGGISASPALQRGLVYRLGEIEIRVSSHCDERCHVGRIASLTIILPPASQNPPRQIGTLGIVEDKGQASL